MKEEVESQPQQPSPYFSLLRLALTFGDAERVVAAGHKVVERHKQVAVILAGSGQQVLLGVPAGRFGQALTLGVRFLKSFCGDGEGGEGFVQWEGSRGSTRREGRRAAVRLAQGP